jgi:hypothetical protein
VDPFPGATSRPATLHRLGYAHRNPILNSDPSGYFVGGMAEVMAAVSMVATVWPPGHPGHTFWDLKDILSIDAWLGDMAAQAAPYVSASSGSRCDNESPFGEFGIRCFERTTNYGWQWSVGGYGPGAIKEEYRAGLSPGTPSSLIDLDFVYLTEHGESGWFKVTHPGRHGAHQRRFQDRGDLSPATPADIRFVADFVRGFAASPCNLGLQLPEAK